MNELKLRNYQEKSIQQLRIAFTQGGKHQIMVAPCAAGKTVIAASIIKSVIERGKKVIFLIDRIVLANQTSETLDRYGIPHGIIQSQHERYEPHQLCQIVSGQTLIRRDCPDDIALVIQDECFHGDTLIDTIKGKVPIKFVSSGELVYNALGIGTVEAISTRRAEVMYEVKLSNGKTIKCTGNHQFFTGRGWKKARDMEVGCRLFSRKEMQFMRGFIPSTDRQVSRRCYREQKKVHGEVILQQQMQVRWWYPVVNREGRIGEKDLRGLSSRIWPISPGERGNTDSYDGRGCIQQADHLLKVLLEEAEEPHAQQGILREDEDDSTAHRTQAASAGWKREIGDCSTEVHQKNTRRRVDTRVYTEYKSKKIHGDEDAASLQDRYCESQTNDGNRGGREVSLFDSKARTRQKERCLLGNVWVESIKSHKPEGDGIVYNLQVSGHPSYYAGGVLVHNCHVRSKAVERLAAYNKDAYFAGFTATPYAKGMAKFWDGCIVIAKAQELTESGHLVPLRYYAKAAPDTSKVKVSCGEYNLKELAEVTDRAELTGDVVENWIAHGEDRQTIAFGINIAHCKHMAQAFNRRGIVTEQIDCFTDTEDRAGMFRRFKSGETRILTSVAVLSVGFSETSASCCIMARATKSLILWHQCVGRIARTHEGKIDGIVFDHGNNAVNLGLPTDEQDYTLDDGKPKKQSEARERKEPLPKSCTACGYIKPAGIHKCPSCGFAPERIESPEFEAGELVELKRAKKARKEFTLQQKREFLAGLNKYAHEKGFRRGKKGVYGWAIHQFTEKFGCSPSNKIQWGAIGTITPEVTGWIQHMAIARRYGSHK